CWRRACMTRAGRRWSRATLRTAWSRSRARSGPVRKGSTGRTKRWAAMFEGNASDFLEAVDSAIRAEQEEIDRKNDPDFKAPPDDVVLTLRDLFRVRVDDPAWWQQQITVDPETGQTTFLQADDGPDRKST